MTACVVVCLLLLAACAWWLQVVGVEQPPAGRAAGRLRGSEKLPDWVDGHVFAMSVGAGSVANAIYTCSPTVK